MERLHRTCALEEVRKNSLEETQNFFYQESIYYQVINSPVGFITLAASENALVSLSWEVQNYTHKFKSVSQHPILMAAEIQLKEFFIGQRSSFDIPLDPKGTDFQKRVWKELSKIPYGQTITYGEQAKRLGQPKSARAVGAANGKNPIGIIIPCHRVIGANGSLTGFAGGIETKRKLLEMEGVWTSQNNIEG